MKKIVSFTLVLLVVGLTLILPPLSGTLIASGEAVSQRSTPPPVNVTGTPQVVVVSGSNYEMGVQYGEQAAALIYANKQIINQILVAQFGAETVANDVKVWTYYLEKYDPKLKDWLRGISAGCKKKRFKVSYADLVANMVYPQELWARPEDPYPHETGVKTASTGGISPASAKNSKPYCQSFGATKTATKDGKPLVSIAAGTDFEVINHVILIAFPTDGYSFIAFPTAGRIANNEGMNSQYGWVMPAAPAIHSIWGVTSEVYFHYLLQYAASPAEAQQYLDSTPRGGVTGNFIFADPTGNLYAYEANGQKAAARKPGDLGEKDFVIMGNDFVGPSMKDQNWPDVWAASYNKTMRDRYETVFEWLLPAAERSMIDVDFVKAVWETPDWYDSVTKEWHYNDPLSDSVPVNAGGPMHQHIYFPADKIAYIQFGNPLGVGANWPANPTGEYTKWQLKNSPAEVASAAGNDAFSMYTAASGLFDKMSNAGDLDYNTSQSLKAKLNEAMLAWSDGIDREAFAYDAATNGATERVQMALWSDALTNYAKTQLYAQMVTTALNALANPVNPDPSPYADTGTPQVVVVSGTNYEMGMQYGLQTAPAIAHNLALMKSALYKAFGSAATTNDMKVWDYYMKQYDPTLQDWLLGILKGCRQKGYDMSYLDLVLLMVFPSEMWARPRDPYPPMTGVQAEGTSLDTVGESAEDIHSCNAFAATGKATKDGKPIIGIDQMVSSLAMNTVILVAFPTTGASFVSVPYAGRVNGNSAMNSYGLAWTLTAQMSPKPVWGLITEVLFHYFAQIATTPAEVQDYLKSTPRAGVTGGVTTSDAEGNLSVFETNDPAKYTIRKPGDEGETGPFVVMTNHLVDPSTQTYARSSSFYRYATTFKYVSDAAATSSIDFSFAKNMFASDDWYDPDAKQWHYNEPSSGNIANSLGGTVNESIYFPASLTAYFGVGTPSGNGMPAYATGEYVKIQLGKDPNAVTTSAGSAAYSFYRDARNFYETDFNANAPYLTASLATEVKGKLDEAFLAYELGMDRAGFAYLATDKNTQLALYAEAASYYAKAQMFSQKVKTNLLKAKAAWLAAQPPYVSTGFPQVVVVSGTNYEMGLQYGQQAGPAIAHNLALLKSRLYDVYGSDTTTKDMQVWDYYLRKYDPTYKDWLQGISDACTQQGYNASYLDLILLMVYPSEMWARPTDPYPPETGVQALEGSPAAPTQSVGTFHSCNSFAATGSLTKDGKPIHGITQMVGAETMDTVILVAFPKDGAAWVSVPYAGRVNGNSAMNSNGFAWTLTAIMQDKPIWGLITEVYFHYLAQITKSITEAQDYLKSTPRAGVTGGVTMSDAAGNISVFECNADHYVIRKPGDEGEPGPFTVMTNHLVDPTNQPYNPPWLSFMGTYARYDTVFEYLKEAAPNSVDFSFAKKVFASDDWYDAAAKQWHYNDPGANTISNSHGSINQSIYFPADLTAYFQAGTPSGNGLPAYATGEYVKIKLGEDPKAVTYQADADALAFYWDAADSLERDLNAKAPYLTTSVVEDIKENLDQAFFNYSLGMDRASFADLETDAQKQLDLWAAALTYYAKAQLYAQMAKTMLLEAKGSQ